MIVLDTHVWLWWVNLDRERLKAEWRARIEAEEPVGVSAISCFEVAWLAQHGRIELPCPIEEWFDKALTGSGIELLPVTLRIAGLSVALPEHHRDPQDRMIIATSLACEATLISADSKFALYQELSGRLLD